MVNNNCFPMFAVARTGPGHSCLAPVPLAPVMELRRISGQKRSALLPKKSFLLPTVPWPTRYRGARPDMYTVQIAHLARPLFRACSRILTGRAQWEEVGVPVLAVQFRQLTKPNGQYSISSGGDSIWEASTDLRTRPGPRHGRPTTFASPTCGEAPKRQRQ